MFQSLFFVQGLDASALLGKIAELGPEVVGIEIRSKLQISPDDEPPSRESLSEVSYAGEDDRFHPVGVSGLIRFGESLTLIFNPMEQFVRLEREWLDIESVYDNKGKTYDRYSINLECGSCFLSGPDGNMPNGVFMHEDGHCTNGNVIKPERLPLRVRMDLRRESVLI